MRINAGNSAQFIDMRICLFITIRTHAQCLLPAPNIETDAKKMNWISLPDLITYTKVNIDLNWTADEHGRHDKERPHRDASFRPSSNCVLQSSLNKPFRVRESKGAGSFARAKVWLSEVRQYFLTLALVITAVLALKELAIERIGLPEWTLAFAFIPPLLGFLFRTIPRLIQTRANLFSGKSS